ncbi:unnamed protein product, partial [Meganyctiphanes norvegica]
MSLDQATFEKSTSKKILLAGNPYLCGLVRLNPGNWLVSKIFTQYANRLYDFEWKTDDVLIMTYPKCGTTWTQELVWTMRNNPELNHMNAGVALAERVPFLDQDMLFDYEKTPASIENPLMRNFFMQNPDAKNEAVFFQMAEKLGSPRTIKTHLPFSLFSTELLDKVKVIYVARNPKDVVVSYYHHHRMLKAHNYVGSFDDFVDYFVNDEFFVGCNDILPYWLHVQEAWQKRNHPNLLFLFYEDMKANINGQISNLNDYLGTKLTTDQIEKVADYCNFSSMSARNNTFLEAERAEEGAAFVNLPVVEKDGGFYRKGTTGSWKEKFTSEHEKKIKKWTDEHFLDLGLDFKYSL